MKSSAVGKLDDSSVATVVQHTTRSSLQRLLGLHLSLLLILVGIHECFSATTPLQVELLTAEYTTFVYSAYLIDDDTDPILISRQEHSSAPHSDAIYNEFPPGWGDDGVQHLEAEATARALEVETFTRSVGAPGSWASAAALTTINFSPLVDASQTINLEFSGWYEWFFSAQYIRLVDVTLDQELWSYAGSGEGTYGWTNSVLLPPDAGYQSWISWQDNHGSHDPDNPIATASENPSTDFLATHEYELTIYAKTHSQPSDAQQILIQVSGLEVVPEPKTHYVNINNPSPSPPYTTWATAATNIQDAVDAACAGDTVLVTNGVYASGGRPVYGTMTNRVAVDKPLSLLSVNGPEVTIIEGYQIPTNRVGDGAIRCVYLTNGVFLSGFTLRNGATRTGGHYLFERTGGGLLCWPIGATVSNCVVTGNYAVYGGGGASGATMSRCLIASNVLTQNRGGGGGVYQSALSNCVLRGNSAFLDRGGGASRSRLDNCMVIGNAAREGGGAAGGTLNNCTISGNIAVRFGGGVTRSTVRNCIIYFNTAAVEPNHHTVNSHSSCTTPLPEGTGNITNAPLFVDTNDWADLRLRPNSPCIDAGNNDFVTWDTDLDGNPRIIGGIVDMGAYEFVPLTPADLVQQLIDAVNESDLHHKRPLLASLEAALASIERDSCHSAEGQLGAFQNKVGAQVSDKALATELIAGAGQVITALDCDGSPRVAARIHSLKRHPNGKMQMKIRGEAGRSYILEASTNLVDWEAICVAVPDEVGRCEVEDDDTTNLPRRFYRVVKP